jgi:Bacterial SH3 domain
MGWFLKTFTGLIIALLILGVGSYFAVQYVLAQLTAPPPRPSFPNDKAGYVRKGVKTTAKGDIKPTETKSNDAKDPEPAVAKPLPAGAFSGRVKQPIGLIIRDNPEAGSSQSGGVEYNEPVVVLETTADGAWQKIRFGSSNREGWVKGGNVEKITP